MVANILLRALQVFLQARNHQLRGLVKASNYHAVSPPEEPPRQSEPALASTQIKRLGDEGIAPIVKHLPPMRALAVGRVPYPEAGQRDGWYAGPLESQAVFPVVASDEKRQGQADLFDGVCVNTEKPPGSIVNLSIVCQLGVGLQWLLRAVPCESWHDAETAGFRFFDKRTCFANHVRLR